MGKIGVVNDIRDFLQIDDNFLQKHLEILSLFIYHVISQCIDITQTDQGDDLQQFLLGSIKISLRFITNSL
jgi:hypothetical protein